MKSKILVVTFLILNSCSKKMPEVTINQLDLNNGIVNPFKIKKYDNVNCKIETEDLPSFDLSNKELHGGFCFTASDFAKIKTYMKSKCENEKSESNLISGD